MVSTYTASSHEHEWQEWFLGFKATKLRAPSGYPLGPISSCRKGGKPRASLAAETKLRRHNFAEVRNAGKSAQHFVDQRKVRPADRRIRVKHHHLVKECIDGGTQSGDQG
jgi:hypothetical protein